MSPLESDILTYLRERGWDKLRPSDLAKSICIEAAELLEIFQWTSQSLEETRSDVRRMELLRKELADVLIYAFDLAVLLGLDTEQIMREKLEKIKQKYPAELMRQSAQEGSGSGNDAAYLRIKQEYRRNGE